MAQWWPGPGRSSSPALAPNGMGWSPSGGDSGPRALSYNETQTIPGPPAATIPGFWIKPESRLSFVSAPFAAPYDAVAWLLNGDSGTVNQRALWQGPVIDTMPELAGSMGPFGNAANIWRPGAKLVVRIRGFDSIGTDRDQLSISYVDSAEQMNPANILPTTLKQEITSSVYAGAGSGGSSPVCLVFEPTAARYWQLTLVFDNRSATNFDNLLSIDAAIV